MRRWRKRYERHGYDGLFDRRTERPSPKRVRLLKTVERVLRLYREQYFDFNVKHFVEKMHQEHGIVAHAIAGEYDIVTTDWRMRSYKEFLTRLDRTADNKLPLWPLPRFFLDDRGTVYSMR